VKKILLFLILIGAGILASMHYIIVPKAINNIQDSFQNLGFKESVLEKTNFNLNGIHVEKIILDKDGFNSANNVNISLFWPTYIFKPSVKSITIDQLKISSVANSPKDILAYKYHLKTDKIKKFTAENVAIKTIIWDIATPKHALRIEGDLKLHNEEGDKVIKANLNANQHELRFQSQWFVNLKNNEVLNLEATYSNLDIHTKTLKIKRGTGWLALNSTSKKSEVTAQLDAGNGNFLGIPTSSISLVLSTENDNYPLLLRTSASGIQGVELYGDFKFSQDIKNQAFELLLKLEDPNKFVNYLKQQGTVSTTDLNKTYPTENTNIYLTYQPKNRFADGPFPFMLDIKENNESNLSGTFLIYPNNLDIRGTAQGDNKAISFLQTLFSIDDNSVSDGNIRLDGNLKNLH